MKDIKDKGLTSEPEKAKLEKELIDAIDSSLVALNRQQGEKLKLLKAQILDLFEKGAQIGDRFIRDLENHIEHWEMEYWDDRAVYAGRSVKQMPEYWLLQAVKKLEYAKDKAEAFDSLFMLGTQSKGVTYKPKTKAELKKLVKDYKIYLGDIDVTCIKNFVSLFENSKRKDFSGIELWDTSNVTTMENCFCNAKHFNVNIQSWNVSNVKNMCGMFSNSNFNQPLNEWNVSKVKEMTVMFEDAKKFNQPLDKWNVKNVEYIARIFNGAKSFAQNIDSWELPKVDFDGYMKNGAINSFFMGSPLEKNPPKWVQLLINVPKENGKYQPKNKGELVYLVVSKDVALGDIDVSLITDMSCLFYKSFLLERIKDFKGIETWNVSNVTNMERMFSGVTNLNVDIGSWNVAKVKNMENMFLKTGGVKQNLEMWQISSDCNIRDMFKDSSLEKNLPKLLKVINGETSETPLADVNEIYLVIKQALERQDIACYARIYQKVLESLKNILSHKKINDEDLYKIFHHCLNRQQYITKKNKRKADYSRAKYDFYKRATFVPLELLELLVENAKDKSLVLRRIRQSEEDFLKIALESGRADIAAFLVKNGVEFKESHLEYYLSFRNIEAFEAEFQGMGFYEIAKKQEGIKVMWDTLIQNFSFRQIYLYPRAKENIVYALRNNLFSEEVLDTSFVDSSNKLLPFVFAILSEFKKKSKESRILEYALFKGLHKGRKNDKGEDFESFLQQKIDEYTILATKGVNYETIGTLAYFKALQRFMNSLDSLKNGKTIKVDDDTLNMFANIDEIPLSSLDTSEVTDMYRCFYESSRRDFSGIEKWNVSKVRDFTACFEGAYFFDVDISSWNVSNKVDLYHKERAFDDTLSLKTLPSWY